jgi:hypothetical protein
MKLTYGVRLLFIPRWLIRRPLYWLLFWLLFTPILFLIDSHCSLVQQAVLSIIVWWMLIGALSARSQYDRLLLSVLVVVATLCEMGASLTFHWYQYRLHNIPAWVPPGHGIVFLTVLLTIEQDWAKRHARLLQVFITICCVSYGLVGLFDGRHDVVGALYGLMFLLWLWFTGPEKARFYSMLWVGVCYLEVCGVLLGAWHWSKTMPVSGLSENSPPSGIVGAYGIFDLMAFLITYYISRIKIRNYCLDYLNTLRQLKSTTILAKLKVLLVYCYNAIRNSLVWSKQQS